MKALVRYFSITLITVLSACAGIGSAGTPAAAGSSQSSAVVNGTEVFQKIDVHPAAAAPPILINFVSNGPAQGGVPCINCVSGASSSDNIGMTGPSSYVPTGATWQYTLSFTDVSYKGKCTLAWTIVGGKKTIDSFSKVLTLTSDGGFVLYGINRARPSYNGAATLTGKVTCGKTKASLQVPLYFE